MKRAFLLLFLLLSAAALSAQELTGTWTRKITDLDEEMTLDATETLAIREDGTFDHALDAYTTMKIDEETTFYLRMLISASGNWTREGDVLTFKPVGRKCKAEIVDTDIPGILKAFLGNTIKKEFLKELKKTDTEQIVSLTDAELTLFDPAEKEQADQLSVYTRGN